MINLEKALANRRMLIVDDLVEARSSLKKMASMLGAGHVDVATDGIEAMARIQENDYDIILSDYNLGRTKDGQQILEESRFTERLRSTSLFIVITGENAIDMVMGALEYDPDGYITKPYTLNMLKERLIRIISVKEELRKVHEAIDLGMYDRAIKFCLEVLEVKPRLRLPASRLLGQLLIRERKFEQALKIYSNLLNERSVSWAKLGQAICIHKLGDSDSALALLKQTLVDHPLYVQCYDWIARILMKQGKPKAAQKALQKAIEISPKAVLRQMELGRVAYENGDTEVAEQAFKHSVRLGRYSCHKSVQNYLQFARAAQKNLKNPLERTTKNKAGEAIRALEELRQDFGSNKDAMFEASIVESRTHSTMENRQNAVESADKANKILEQMEDPKVIYKLDMTEVYIDIEEAEKAQTLIEQLKDLKLDDKLSAKVKELDYKLNGEVQEQQATSLNDKGVTFYEQGDLTQAMKIFDQATGFEYAGPSVLLNSIQAKITYMEQSAPNKKMLKECRSLLIRIGEIKPDDERFGRYSRLRKTYERLCRAA